MLAYLLFFVVFWFSFLLLLQGDLQMLVDVYATILGVNEELMGATATFCWTAESAGALLIPFVACLLCFFLPLGC